MATVITIDLTGGGISTEVGASLPKPNPTDVIIVLKRDDDPPTTKSTGERLRKLGAWSYTPPSLLK